MFARFPCFFPGELLMVTYVAGWPLISDAEGLLAMLFQQIELLLDLYILLSV